MLAQNPFVVILAQHQDVWEGTQFLSHFVEWDACLQSAARPHIRPVAGLPQLDRALRQIARRVELKRARVYRHRSRLKSRTAITVDNHRTDTPSADLIREHQTGRARSHYENVNHHSPSETTSRKRRAAFRENRNMPSG